MRTGQWRWLQRKTLAVTAAIAVALLVCQSSTAKGPEQDFADEAACKIEPFYGGGPT